MSTVNKRINQLRLLKKEAGSHSPSLFTIKEAIPDLEVKVDACFLSNPYATDLFIEYFIEKKFSQGCGDFLLYLQP